MVVLVKNDALKIEILKQFKKKNISYTASLLASYLNARYETVRRALEFLTLIGATIKETKEHGKKNHVYYDLTPLGKEIITKLE